MALIVSAGAVPAHTDFGQLLPAFGHSVGLGLERPYIIKGELTVLERTWCLRSRR